MLACTKNKVATIMIIYDTETGNEEAKTRHSINNNVKNTNRTLHSKKKTSSELEGSTAYCIRCYTHTLNTDCGRSQCQASWLEPSPLGTPECKGSEP